MRRRTVVAYLALFAALAGTAWAAATIGSNDVRNNTLKSVDLKNSAGVKSPDVVNRSLAGRDVRNGSLAGGDFGADSIGGADTNEAALSVARVSHRLGGPVGLQLGNSLQYKNVPNTTFVQLANESDQVIAGGQVTFPATCTQPRSSTLVLTIDDPTISATTVMGIGQVTDNSPGTVTKRFTFGVSPFGFLGQTIFRTGAPVNHEFFVLAGANCNSGAGVTLDSISIDVVGHQAP